MNCWKFGCLLAVAAVTATQGATLFVNAQFGDDSNSGMAAAKPFLTIMKAVKTAAERPGPDVIQIAGGQYTENVVIKDGDPLTLSGSDGVEIVAKDTAKEVIYVKLGDVTISNLKVSGGKVGIRGSGSAEAPVYLTLKKVESADNTDRGFRAVDVLAVSISDCEFLNNAGDGMKVAGDTLDPSSLTLSMKNTLISGSGDDGIDLEALGEVRLVNVTVLDTLGDDGLAIDDTASVFIAGCSFVNSAAEGIDIDDTGTVTIVSSLSAANGGAGLQLKAEEHYDMELIRIIDTDFVDNGEDGVWMGEEAAAIESASLVSVKATGNAESGLEINVSGQLKLSAVTSENNGSGDVLP